MRGQTCETEKHPKIGDIQKRPLVFARAQYASLTEDEKRGNGETRPPERNACRQRLFAIYTPQRYQHAVCLA